MSLYPPPRMPSPQLVPVSLPSPPIFPRRVSSRSRLHLPHNLNEPPIPPRLVGSPLLDKLVNPHPATLTPKIQKQLWFDGDEFGTRTSNPTQSSEGFPFSQSSPPSTPRGAPTRRLQRRTSSIVLAARARSHSPPPPQQLSVAIPPVPPIPSSAFDCPGTKRPVLRTPPHSPTRPRPAQIIIPDLASVSPSTSTPNRLPSPALRPHHSRSRPSASPRRRALGSESH